ncbi:MAG: metalloregulator ArsR/SmtB family transcription factor [Anaerolineae bacterium]|nr:metalloregulator ArsR/SmtB family transcription factor [Anaerolineae bacterium]
MESTSYKEAADVFQLLSHPVRLHILDELRRGEACVCHLQAVLQRPQAYVSQHLGVLRAAAVVEGQRDGLNIYYRIVDDRLLRLLVEALGPAQDARSVPICPCPSCAGD